MQQVSEAWTNNQKAIVRDPGFVVVETPGLKISCGTVSYSKEIQTSFEPQDDGTVIAIAQQVLTSDPVGCEHIAKCVVRLKCRTTEFYPFTVSTLDHESNVISTIKVNSATELDSNAEYSWQTSGFYRVKVTVLGMVIPTVTQISLDVYGIPASSIKALEHTRSYDPMGFELPTNNVSIDLYNIGDMYTELYRGYNGEKHSIVVSYGYRLTSGDEVIRGGKFTLTDMQLSDDGILTLTGESQLAFVDDKATLDLFDLKADEDNCISVVVNPESVTSGSTSVDLSSRAELQITVSDLVAALSREAAVAISCSDEYANTALNGVAINSDYISICQELTSFLLCKSYIDRQDVLHYDYRTTTSVESGADILQSNSLDEPAYASAKSVRKFEIEATSYENTATATKTDSVEPEEYNSRMYIDLDTVSNKLKSCSMQNVYCLYKLELYKTYVRAYYRARANRAPTINVVYAPPEPLTENIQVTSSGAICDIENSLGKPTNTTKIANYFNNRDLYTFNLRGNPARDVGDYINVSLSNDADTTTYKKGLLLSSTLTYDGSFKEECTVRIINTEFE